MIGLNDILSSSMLPGPLAALFSRDVDITFNFTVLVGGIPLGDFYAVETFQRGIEVHTYNELGKNDAPHELIGKGNLGHVVLKWGLMNRSSLWDWLQEVEVQGDFRRDVLIIQMNRGKIPIRTYNLRGAWPVRWTGANLDANSSTNAVEELELSYRKLEVNAIPLPF
jgi:phage tail-like protein